MKQARPYQIEIEADVEREWAEGAQNVAAILPTGGGKTFVASSIVCKHNEPTCIIAHRHELVHQMSMALAEWGVVHRIIGSDDVIRMAVRSQIRRFGKEYYHPNSKVAVASVATLTKRTAQLAPWARTVKLWVLDECHHLLADNMWGKACRMFPNAKGLGITATLGRADGHGLGRHADGLIDTFVTGPSMRDLIRGGFLTPYRVLGPKTRMDLTNVPITATGDFSRNKLKLQVRKSTIVGDVVGEYKKHAMGLLGLTFATDVETATDFTRAYNEAGVPAELVTAKTPTVLREEIFDRFERRQLLQVVNVDILGEGFDCPAIEVVSMARPTESLNLYFQQFGRALRPMPDKPEKVALVLDHVGNVSRHLLPDRNVEWSLDRTDRKSRKSGGIPVRVCTSCTGVYESIHKECPYCGYVPVPADRSKPEFVDGDLTEMSADLIQALQGEIYRINQPSSAVHDKLRNHAGPMVAAGAAKQHRLRQEAQDKLRASIALWAGHQRAAHRPDYQSYRLFYYTFGVDVLTAQTLGRPAAEDLTARVNERIAI